mgnify:FL=1|jgi:hypothetical protein|nr:MAG TPA: hypothetical protein [Herelleviridae sp.]
MSDFDFTNTEEALRNLQNQLKNAEQAYARKALSEAIGIDLDKIAALIEDGAAEQTEQEEPEPASDSDVLAEDLFTAQDPNGLQSTYKAVDLPFGTVITIEGDEFLHALIDHDDHGHSVWVNTMAELLDDNAVAELARNANGNVTIVHFG